MHARAMDKDGVWTDLAKQSCEREQDKSQWNSRCSQKAVGLDQEHSSLPYTFKDVSHPSTVCSASSLNCEYLNLHIKLKLIEKTLLAQMKPSCKESFLNLKLPG